MLNSASSSVAKFIKIAPECALKPSPCGCSPAFLQRHQVHKDPAGGCVWGGVCVQRCGLAWALPAPLLSQNIWASARTSAPGTGHWHQAVLLLQLLSQQQAAVGKGKHRLVTLLQGKVQVAFLSWCFPSAAFTVGFGMFPRWGFMDICGFHKGLNF